MSSNTRLVTGKILKIDGSPWVNTRVIIRLTKGSYTSTSQFPPNTLEALTDSEGNLTSGNSPGVNLWCNTEGSIASRYEFLLPSDKILVDVPYGDGTPIDLAYLRAQSETSTPPEQVILDYIDDALSGTEQTSYVAAESVSASKVICLNSEGKAKQASIDDFTEINTVTGISKTAADPETSFHVAVVGIYKDINWNWNPGETLYLGLSGDIVSIPDLARSHIVKIGRAVRSSEIFLQIEVVKLT